MFFYFLFLTVLLMPDWWDDFGWGRVGGVREGKLEDREGGVSLPPTTPSIQTLTNNTTPSPLPPHPSPPESIVIKKMYLINYPRYPSSCNLETLTMERFFNGFFLFLLMLLETC